MERLHAPWTARGRGARGGHRRHLARRPRIRTLCRAEPAIIPAFLPTTSVHILGSNVGYGQMIVTRAIHRADVVLYLSSAASGPASRCAAWSTTGLLSLTGRAVGYGVGWLIGSVFASLSGYAGSGAQP